MHNQFGKFTLGDLLRKHRDDVPLTQAQLAKMLGYHGATLSRIERGTTWPRLDFIQNFVNLPAFSLTDAQKQQILDLFAEGPYGTLPPQQARRTDWGSAPDITQFAGRADALETVKGWAVTDQCRLIAILGTGGVGKTTLASKVAHDIESEFTYVVWRTLINAPPLTDLLPDLLAALSNQQALDPTLTVGKQISLLLTLLKENRCLLILDNMESILQAGKRSGIYRAGYEDYGQLLQQVGTVSHQSCLLLTSREQPKELIPMASPTAPVRTITLSGMTAEESQMLLQDRHLEGDTMAWEMLNHFYAGNPFILKIVSASIQFRFSHSITHFIKEITSTVFGDIKPLLNQQFDRLSELERDIMVWLAINREPTTLDELKEDLLTPANKETLFAHLESLKNRSLIEYNNHRFSLQNVMTEHIIERLINQIWGEITTRKADQLNRYALTKAQAKTYVRESQERLILQPIGERLLSVYSQAELENRLRHLLDTMRQNSPRKPGYLGGNILNLICHLGWELKQYDFSHLAVWQANLQGTNFQDINFNHADITKSSLIDTFGTIRALAFSPDEQSLVIATADMQILRWHLATNQKLVRYVGHTDSIATVNFSPDGQFLASGGRDGIVRIWEADSGLCLKMLKGHAHWVRKVVFYQNGRFLISGGDDDTIRIWDVNSGKCLSIIQAELEQLHALDISPDENLLAVGGRNTKVKIWDLKKRNWLVSLVGHTEPVWSVNFSRQGHMLATSGTDNIINLWDIESNQCVHTFFGHSDQVRSIEFSPDGKMLASGSYDKSIKLWDIKLKQCVRTDYHEDILEVIKFNGNGQLLASGGTDNTVKVWGSDNLICIKLLKGFSTATTSLAFNKSGKTLASGHRDNRIRLWDIDLGKLINFFQGQDQWLSLEFHPDNEYLLNSCGPTGIVQLWDTRTNQCLHLIQEDKDSLKTLTVSPKSQLIAIGRYDHVISIFDGVNRNKLYTLKGHTDRIISVTFHPNYSLLASGGNDSNIKIWDLEKRQCLSTLKGHSDGLRSLAFNTKGSLLASGGVDQDVRIWDFDKGQCLHTLKGHSSWVWSVAFSPVSNILASGGEDKVINLWDPIKGILIKTLKGHSGKIRKIVFQPNSNLLASGSLDETIKLWDITTGECLRTLRPDRPYERMNIQGITGLSDMQVASLKLLGAMD